MIRFCRCFGGTEEAAHLQRFWQVTQVVLKGIGNPGVFFYDPAFANQLILFHSQHVIDEFVEVWIMGKNNVATFVPHEAVIIHMGTSVASNVIGFFVEHPVLITKFMQTVSCAEAGGTTSDDDDSLAHFGGME